MHMHTFTRTHTSIYMCVYINLKVSKGKNAIIILLKKWRKLIVTQEIINKTCREYWMKWSEYKSRICIQLNEIKQPAYILK